jgi:hypothetical protein
MRLYSGTTKSLIEDSTCNRISYKLKDAFLTELPFGNFAHRVCFVGTYASASIGAAARKNEEEDEQQ